MQTKNLIQAQANVVKITALKKGDVFKYIRDDSYSSNETYYGVVLDLFNSGNKSFIQVLLYKRSYGHSIETEVRLFNGTKDINIFPATVDEVKEYFEGTLDSLKKEIEKTKKQIINLESAYCKASEFMSGETSKKLTEMSYTEITQDEYNKIEQKRHELLEGKPEDLF